MHKKLSLFLIITILLVSGAEAALVPFLSGGGSSSSSSSGSSEDESGDKGMYKIIRKHLEEDEYWEKVPKLDTRNDKEQRYDKELSEDAKKAILYCFSMREEEEEDAGEETFKGYSEEDMVSTWRGVQTTSGRDDGFSATFNTRYQDRALNCIRKRQRFFHFQLWMETMGGLITQTANDEDKDKEKRRKDDEWVIKEEERKKKNFDIFSLWRKKLGEGVLQTLHNTDEEEEKKGEKNAYVEDFTYFTYEDEGQGEMSHEEPDGTYKEGRPAPPDKEVAGSTITDTTNFADYMELNGVIGLISDAGIFMEIVNQSPGRGRRTTNKKFEAQETATGGTEGAGAVGEHFQKQRLWSRNPGRNPGYSLFFVEKDEDAEEGESPYTPFEYEGEFFDEFNNRLDEFLNKTYCKDEIAKRLKDKGLNYNVELQLIQRCQDLELGIWERLFQIEKFATKFNDQFLEGKHLYLASTRETENIWSFNLWANLVDEALDELLKQQDDDPEPQEEEAEEPEELECKDEYPEFQKIIDRVKENIDQDLKEILDELKKHYRNPPSGDKQTDAFYLLEQDQVKVYMDNLVKEYLPESFQDKYKEYWDKMKEIDQKLFQIRHSEKDDEADSQMQQYKQQIKQLDEQMIQLAKEEKDTSSLEKQRNEVVKQLGAYLQKQAEEVQKLRNKAGGIVQGHYDIWNELLPAVLVDEYLVPYFNVKSVIENEPYFQKFVEDNKRSPEETKGSGDSEKDTEYLRNLSLELDWHKLRACRDQEEHGEIAEKKKEHAKLPSEDEPDFEINKMNGEVKEVNFTVCREKRVPPIAGIKFDRTDRCSKFLTEKQLEIKLKEKAKNRDSWDIWSFKLADYKKDGPETSNTTDATEDEGQKSAIKDRKHQHEMYMSCLTDYNILNAQLEHSVWKEWFGNENWDGEDPGIQYDCITDNEQVGTKWSIQRLNEILRSMKHICSDQGKDPHNIALPCPDRIDEIEI